MSIGIFLRAGGYLGGGGGGSGSLSVSSSSTTPSFGQEITITATASGFTPDSYTFSVPDNLGAHTITTQGGNTFDYTCAKEGSHVIYVKAEDSVSGKTACDQVSITVGTLETKYSIDAAYGKTVTLVSDKVDVWSDITGNSHNATAPSATTRGYTTKWGGSSECVGVSTENDDRLITNLNMNTSEVTLYGVFDFNDNTVQGNFDVQGIISGDSNITNCRFNATILDDTYNPRTVRFQVRTSSGAFSLSGNLVNGKVIFVYKYSSGTMRTIINGTTSSQSVTGTLVGTGTINYALLNVNTGGWGSPFPFPVYSLGIKTAALSDSDQDQLYADLLVKYPY